MKKLFTCFALVAMLAFAGCGTFGDDNVGPNGDQTEQPNGNEDEKPNEGGDENQNPDTPKQYKIYVYNAVGWEPLNIYMWRWDDEDLTEYVGAWSGAQVEETEVINGFTYYVYDLPTEANGKEIGVIFNNGSGLQTPDWFITVDKDYYVLLSGTSTPTIIEDKNNPIENGGDENPDTPKQYKIYVYNLFGWESVYVYVWDKENLTEYAGKWCGTKMTGTEEINGHTYLVYELPEAASGRELGVIFNNGQGTQTPDWFVTLDKDCYMLLLGTYPIIIQDKNNPTEGYDCDFEHLEDVPETHKIYYSLTDVGILVTYSDQFGANIIENIYSAVEKKGVIVFDGDVTSIGEYAFSDCDNLASITIPDSVTSIGEKAFFWCENLASVNIGNSVTSIGRAAFYDCSSLASITIPEGVTSIGVNAFSGCSSLASITIPDSVTSIGEYAFSDCNNLTEVYISNIAAWCRIKFDSSTSNPLSGKHNLYLNGELTTNLVIPEGVTSVGDFAFYDCSGLASINIPEGVTSIGRYAFCYCSNIPVLTIPASVTSIGMSAFNGWNSVTRVYCKPTKMPSMDIIPGRNIPLPGLREGVKIYVPHGLVEDYRSLYGTGGFGSSDLLLNIVGYDF